MTASLRATATLAFLAPDDTFCAGEFIDYACEPSDFDRLLEDPFTGLAVEGGRL